MPKPEQRQLAVNILIVDAAIQRSLDHGRAAKMADELDLDAIGVITVSKRKDGTYHVVDGQHRVEALRLAGGDNVTVAARVFTGLTLEEEARLFRLLNNTTKLQALDKFRVRVVEGEPIAVHINDILTKYRWRVSWGSGAGYFAAVSAAERVHGRDPDAFERTIWTITTAWGHATTGADGRIVDGIGMVHARYGTAIDIDDLARKLGRYTGGPDRLIANAKAVQAMYGISASSGVADIAVELYNKQKKTKAIEPWRA